MLREPLIRRAWDTLLMALYPGRCAGCDHALPWRAVDEPLCEACAGLAERPDGVCPRCGLPGCDAEEGCPTCALDPPPYGGLASAFWYGGPVRAAIHRFKFDDRPHLYRALSAALADVVEPAWPRGVLVGVPMTDRSLRRRGYNPAWLLALGLSRRLGLRAPGGSTLVKVRETAPQRGLGARERRDNVAGAFACRGDVVGRDLWLVDDVLTTGATAGECARVLLGAGARSVRVLALARTPLELGVDHV